MKKRIKEYVYNSFFKEFKQSTQPHQVNYSDISEEEWEIIKEVLPYTATNPERIVSLLRALDYLHDNKIEGDIVECGVWKGGSVMAMLKKLVDLNSFSRDIYLYDTFEGMVAPTIYDKSFKGASAFKAFKTKDKFWNNILYKSPLEEVQRNISRIKYPTEKIKFVKGKVEETIPEKIPDKIAILRLDTDWYESTLHELNHLYPMLAKGGILIIDDYGHWQGCKKAVDEYIEKNQLQLFLSRIDYTCRLAIKN